MRFRQGKLDSALVALAESLALDPTQPLAHLWHAAILVDRGRLDRAADAGQPDRKYRPGE